MPEGDKYSIKVRNLRKKDDIEIWRDDEPKQKKTVHVGKDYLRNFETIDLTKLENKICILIKNISSEIPIKFNYADGHSSDYEYNGEIELKITIPLKFSVGEDPVENVEVGDDPPTEGPK